MCTFYVCVIYGGTGNLRDVKAPDTVLRRGLAETGTGHALSKLCWPDDEVLLERLRT